MKVVRVQWLAEGTYMKLDEIDENLDESGG
jgi:hypothetical protein